MVVRCCFCGHYSGPEARNWYIDKHDERLATFLSLEREKFVRRFFGDDPFDGSGGGDPNDPEEREFKWPGDGGGSAGLWHF